MSANRPLQAVTGTTDDAGRILATRTGKVLHVLEKAYVPEGKAETRCHKFVRVLTLATPELAQTRGCWGLLTGDGHAPTCRGCKLAEQNRPAAPAAQETKGDVLTPYEHVALDNVHSVTSENVLAKIVERAKPEGTLPTVGQLAYVYSRGSLRQGVVVAVGRMRAKVKYTTQGAIDTAHRIYDHHAALDPVYVANQAEARARENYVFMRQEIEHHDKFGNKKAKYGQQSAADHEQRIAKYRETVNLLTIDEYAMKEAGAARQRVEDRKVENKDWRQYVNFTNKTDSFDNLYLL